MTDIDLRDGEGHTCSHPPNDDFYIQGSRVSREDYYREQEERYAKEHAEHEEQKEAKRLAQIGEVLPTLWDVLELYKGPHRIGTAHELRYALFQAIAVELTGETWARSGGPRGPTHTYDPPQL